MKYINSNFLVVSDYNWLPFNLEDSWVHRLSDNYLIYDKYHRFVESNKVKHQKNVGQNIYDIFDFIVTHFNNLPDVTIFCRACVLWPKDTGTPRLDAEGNRLSNGNCSEEHFLKICNNTTFTEINDFYSEPWRVDGRGSFFGSDGGFYELNNSWYLNQSYKTKYYNNINTFFDDFYVNPPTQSYLRFSPGGCYIIPKKNILMYNLKFYEKIREILSWDIIIGEAHMIERALYIIFNGDLEIKKEYIY